jgi:hypothetical protein
LGVFLAAAVFAFLAWRQHQLVDRYAVNLLIWDQWLYYTLFIYKGGWWWTFTYQLGPHRMGVGFLVTRVLANLGHWNVRWDAFGVSFTLMIAAILAWRLARRCGVRPGIWLAAIPLLFFNRHEYAAFSETANISHGAMPVLLIMLYCLSWFIPKPSWRLPVLAGLTFLLIFTGFGLFIGVVAPGLFALEACQAWAAGDRTRFTWTLFALLVVAAGWVTFFYGYVWAPFVPNYRFPYEKPHEYLLFGALMLSSFFGVVYAGSAAVWLGGFVAVALLAVACVYGFRAYRRGVALDPVNPVLFSLAGYELVYLANTAIGRVMLGLGEAPIASRYVILMVPGILSIYLALTTCSRPRLARCLGIAFAVVLVPATAFLRSSEQDSLDRVSTGRRVWGQVYLQTHSEMKATRASNYVIFPTPLPMQLKYVEDHHLDLFNGNFPR